ncbi:ATP-binding cassette domain-containing protein [Kiritimatiellota bacterium B12222]|nr:ATP-binding cassette domain-containing protein [Kiritimatiellota bacterium B12222]
MMHLRSASFHGVLLDLQHTTFRAGDRLIFENTQWQIQSKECWGVVGEMHSGRNALVQGLCGELAPVEGELIYGYEEVDPQFEACPESGIAHVFFTDLQHEMGGDDAFAQLRWNRNLEEFPLLVSDFLSLMSVFDLYALDDVSVERRQAYPSFQAEVLDLLKIGNLFSRELTALSNGERRKVFLARALLTDPLLVVLEHPFEGLDVGYRKELSDIFLKLQCQGLNLMFLAPEEGLLPDCVDHIAEVEEWRLVACGRKTSTRRSSQKRALFTEEIVLPQSWVSRLRPRKHRTPLVSLQGVNVCYGDTKILQDVSWTIQPGECWALSGHNGAGKSTLLSLIQADNPMAYANDVQLFGKPLGPGHSIWDVKKRIGSVSPEQHIYFPEELTVLDTVCTGFFDTLQLFESCGRVRKGIARDWLDSLGLGEKAHKSFAELAVEEQRTVLIARALVRPIDLLILDEPCMGLNEPHRIHLLRLIDAVVGASGCALIFVTHEKQNLPNCVTRFLNLKEGRVTRRK